MGETALKEVPIWSEYITLGQLLKLANVISNGAEAKGYLAEVIPLVNGEEDNRRGRSCIREMKLSCRTVKVF